MGHDLFCEEAEGFFVGSVHRLDDEELDAGVGEGLEVGDGAGGVSGDAGGALVVGEAVGIVAVELRLGGCFALGEHEPCGEVGTEDGVVGAADGVAVLAENGELPADVVGGAGGTAVAALPKVAGVGVLGDLAEGDALAAAGEDEGRAGSLNGERDDAFVVGMVVVAVVGEWLVAPDATNDGDGFFEGGLALGDGGKGETELGELGGVPTDAEAEEEASAAKVIEVGGEAGGVDGGAVTGAENHGAEADPFRGSGEHGEVEPGVGRIGGMVTEEEGVEAALLGELAGGEEPSGGIGVVWLGDDLESEADVMAMGFDPTEHGELCRHGFLPSIRFGARSMRHEGGGIVPRWGERG